MHAIDSAAVWMCPGVEIAHWLFWQISTHGARDTPAKLSATWKSGSLVPPSPMKPKQTLPRSPAIFMAIAMPTACGIWVDTHDDITT